MKQSIDNVEQLQQMERKQKLLLKIRAAIALDHMDLVKELSYEFQTVFGKEHRLNNPRYKKK